MRLTPRLRGTLLALCVGFAALTFSASASAADITVNTTVDEFAGNTDATCSLREAIQAANTDKACGGCPAGSGTDTIFVTGGMLYGVGRGGVPEDQNAAGDFDIS